MKYEVDQSIRIEQTNRDTIIGLTSEDDSFALVVTAKVKRTLREDFRRIGRPKKFMILVFTAGVILAIENSNFNIIDLVIDIEYPGYEKEISSYIKNYFRKELHIYFSIIGKKSKAHYAAYGVHIGKRKANCEISYGEIKTTIKKMTEGPLRT